MTPRSLDYLLTQLAEDPAIYPHQLDLAGERVLLANIPLAAQSTAVFLDQRVMSPDYDAAWCSWPQFESAARGAHEGAPAYIFHVGHCGSTLISQLVEAASGLRALREPMPLRTFAGEAADAATGVSLLSDDERKVRLRLFERLWARKGGAAVKATSICCGLVDEVASAPSAFVYTRPHVYLTALLGGANTHIDLRNFAQMRMRRLGSRTDALGPLAALSPGELAAMSWLAETVSIAATGRDILAIDFDVFLANPAPMLSRLCAHLGRAAADETVERTVRSPLMTRYSKAPEHAFDAKTRAQILAEDGAQFAGEIRAGMVWLERTAKGFPEGDVALARFAASVSPQ